MEAKLEDADKYLFGVFDGHAGCACAQALKDRLFKYIAVALADPTKLNLLYQGGQAIAENLVEYLSTTTADSVSPDLSSIHWQSLVHFMTDTQDMYSVDTNVS